MHHLYCFCPSKYNMFLYNFTCIWTYLSSSCEGRRRLIHICIYISGHIWVFSNENVSQNVFLLLAAIQECIRIYVEGGNNISDICVCVCERERERERNSLFECFYLDKWTTFIEV